MNRKKIFLYLLGCSILNLYFSANFIKSKSVSVTFKTLNNPPKIKSHLFCFFAQSYIYKSPLCFFSCLIYKNKKEKERKSKIAHRRLSYSYRAFLSQSFQVFPQLFRLSKVFFSIPRFLNPTLSSHSLTLIKFNSLSSASSSSFVRKDYYKLLGLNENCTLHDIYEAYRSLCEKFHPNFGGDKYVLNEINEAFKVLSSSKQEKTEFDERGKSEIIVKEEHAKEEEEEDEFIQSISEKDILDRSKIEEIFPSLLKESEIIQKESTRKFSLNGKDIHTTLNVKLSTSCFGGEAKLKIEKVQNCASCDGTSSQNAKPPIICSLCKGKKIINSKQETPLGFIRVSIICRQCSGEGKLIKNICSVCKGYQTLRESVLDIKIPPGVTNGTMLCLKGEGNEGINGGKNGDLYVSLCVEKDAKFSRENNDIISHEQISYIDAILGCKKKIELLSNEAVMLDIPPLTQNGAVFKIKNKGAMNSRNNYRGSHLVVVHLTIPTHLTNEQLELLQKLKIIEEKQNDKLNKHSENKNQD